MWGHSSTPCFPICATKKRHATLSRTINIIAAAVATPSPICILTAARGTPTAIKQNQHTLDPICFKSSAREPPAVIYYTSTTVRKKGRLIASPDSQPRFFQYNANKLPHGEYPHYCAAAPHPPLYNVGARIRAEGGERTIVAGTRMPPLSATSGTPSRPVTNTDSPDPTIGKGDSQTAPLVSPVAPHTTTCRIGRFNWLYNINIVIESLVVQMAVSLVEQGEE